MKKQNKEYQRIHYHLRTKYGKADKCEFEECNGISTHYEWALKKGREYSDNPTDYFQLCKSCHVKYDGYTLSEKGRKSLSIKASERFKGVTPTNKGNNSKITKECKYCKIEYKAYKSKRKTYCSVDCRNKDMINEPTRNKNGRKGKNGS